MGGDGGQVIDRATMVKTRGYGLTKESGGRYNNSLGEMNSYLQMVSEDRGLGTLERHRVRMTTCYLSQEDLRDPVVACRLGNLYNKEALINALLNKTMPEALSHIKALKDVKQCQITWKEAEKEGGLRRMVCPLSREDLDAGCHKAVVIWTSGAIVSPKSLRELKTKECPVTGKEFDPDKDLIPLAPDADELDRLRERLPAKKRKAAPGPQEEAAGQAAATSSSAKDGAPADASGAVKPGAPTPAAPAAGEPASKVAKREVLNSMFRKGGDGFTGTRDGFGTPVYNRGSRIA